MEKHHRNDGQSAEPVNIRSIGKGCGQVANTIFVERKVEGRTRPEANSLRLLPFGPDRIGEAIARADLPVGVLDDLPCKVKE